MTMQQPQEYQLPLPRTPMVTRVISDALFPDPVPKGSRGELLLPPGFPRAEEPILWALGDKHPLVGDMRIVRMFRTDDGVEVYSVAGDGSRGTRNLLPSHRLRFVEESMPIDVFIEEMTIAEEGDEPFGARHAR